MLEVPVLWHFILFFDFGNQVCAKVLPSVMPCLIDHGSASVREAAFGCVTTYLEKLKEVSERMKVEEEEWRRAEVKKKSKVNVTHSILLKEI